MNTLKLKEVCLEITAKCPLNCLHCSGNCSINSIEQLSLSEIRQVLSDLSNLGCEVVEISGGEPLLHPDLVHIIECIKKHKIEPVLYTSGNMLSDSGKMADLGVGFAEKLYAAGLRKIVFNLQSFRRKTHDNITMLAGSFRNVLQAIRSAKSLGFWVGVHFVPMKLNYLDIEGLLSLCHELRVDEVGILRFVPQGRGYANKDLLELSSKEFRVLTTKLTDLTLSHKNPFLRIGRPIDFRCLISSVAIKPPCNAGISRCLIGPDGKVVPCPGFKQNSRFIAGNIKNESLVKIWNESPVFQKFRKFDYTQIGEPCNDCKYLHQCRGGCIAQKALIMDGDIYSSPDPSCFLCHVKNEVKC